MPLTVLPSTFAQSPADLVRLFHQSQLEWSRHLGEETQLDFGRWISNPALADSDEANCLHDAFLLPGLSAVQLIQSMQAKADHAEAAWRCCSLSPSMPVEHAAELADALLQAGWTSSPLTIFYRRQIVDLKPRADLNLTLIPTRASYRHYRELLQHRAAETNRVGSHLSSSVSVDPVEGELLHLDDSHLDSLLALRGGNAVGSVGVLTSGEFGTLRDWHVTGPHRQQGVGRVLLDRALEICTRGLLKHVMIGLPPDAAVAIHLVGQAGFDEIGKWNAYSR